MLTVGSWWGVGGVGCCGVLVGWGVDGGVLTVGCCWGGVLVGVETEHIGCLRSEFNSSAKGRDDTSSR